MASGTDQNHSMVGGVENVGPVDAWIRVTTGLILLTLGATGRLGKRGSLLGIILGAHTAAEGITCYCPSFDLLGISTRPGAQRSQMSREDVAQLIDEAEPVDRTFPWEETSRAQEEPRIQRRSAVTRRL